jgi:signal transduction histidine kinase
MSDSLIIAENERRYVVQELHDHAIQTLLQINMQVGICKRYLELGHIDDTAAELNLLEEQITKASQQLRELIADLRPPLSEDGTFQSMLVKQIEIHQQRGGPPIDLTQTGAIELPAQKKLAIMRIIQEGLSNIRKHAGASQIELKLEEQDTQLEITITDNGKGFDDALIPNPFSEKGGAGMVNMQIRAVAIDGTFDILSHLNRGTTIKVTIPL